MTKEKTIEHIAVMQAYVDGKTIQACSTNTGNWYDVASPEWHSDIQYRVKPESQLRPYIIPKEILNAVKEHGPYLQSKASGAYRMITHISHRGLNVVLSNEDPGKQHSTEDLLNTYTWQDGTPCGVLD